MGQTRSRPAARRGDVGARFDVLVDTELARARRKHGKPFNSEPEGWAVIQEELDEFRDAYRARHGGPKTKCIAELIETAAMCRRAFEDLYSITPGRCSVCGCTDNTPCVGAFGEGCAWRNRARTLCTSCPDPKNPTKRWRRRR